MNATKNTYQLVGEGVTTPNPWGDPEPLVTNYAPNPYPFNGLPSIIRLVVEEVVDFVQAPLPMVVQSALGAVSLAVQALVDVERASKLKGPVGVYLLCIGDSGERKTSCDKFFTHRSKPMKQPSAKRLNLSCKIFKPKGKYGKVSGLGVWRKSKF